MNETQKAKITRFINDKTMSDTVFDVIMGTFTKIRPRTDLGDTQELAARFIAIQLIQESWKELEKYTSEVTKGEKDERNVGL